MIEHTTWQRTRLVAALGSTQTLAWASSYYLIAILADPMANDLGISKTRVFAAFSVALLLTALVGPRIGRTIDRFGGREVLLASNLLFATGLVLLALARGPLILWLGWLIMGIGMGLGLYDAAFATLGRIYGASARSAITGITLVAGFASTVGWPLTTLGNATIGWRATCLAWALGHIVIGLPLNYLALPRQRGDAKTTPDAAMGTVVMDRTMWLLGFAFAAGWIVSTAMAAHLPRLLEAAGATTTQAIAAAAMIGPAQVTARILEASVLKRLHPLLSARISMITHPIGASLLLATGGWFAMPFTILHGAGNGLLTIARGTVPLAVFGPENYGHRLGLLGAPSRILQAGAPLAFGMLIEAYGAKTLVITTGLCLSALCALWLVNPATSPASAAPATESAIR